MKNLAHTLTQKKILAIDPATHSIAFACVEKAEGNLYLCGYGKVDLKGCETSEKFERLNASVPWLIDLFKPTLTYIEQPIYIQNFQTSRLLSYVVGYTWGRITQENVAVIDIGPMQWKSGIGYKKVSAAEKQEWSKIMSAKDLKKKIEFERKNRVKFIMQKKFDIDIVNDDDIVDAIGIAYWAAKQ